MPELDTITSVLVAAIGIGLVSTPFVSWWQHRYWRMQKIVSLQDETYREARELLIALVYGVENPKALVDPVIRTKLGELATDVDRLFSPEAHARVADALISTKRYQQAVVTGNITENTNIESLRGDSVFKVRVALNSLAGEIGTSQWRWWPIWRRKEPRIGRRKYDEVDATNFMPPDREGENRRRSVDEYWKSNTRQSETEGGDS